MVQQFWEVVRFPGIFSLFLFRDLVTRGKTGGPFLFPSFLFPFCSHSLSWPRASCPVSPASLSFLLVVLSFPLIALFFLLVSSWLRGLVLLFPHLGGLKELGLLKQLFPLLGRILSLWNFYLAFLWSSSYLRLIFLGLSPLLVYFLGTLTFWSTLPLCMLPGTRYVPPLLLFPILSPIPACNRCSCQWRLSVSLFTSFSTGRTSWSGWMCVTCWHEWVTHLVY